MNLFKTIGTFLSGFFKKILPGGKKKAPPLGDRILSDALLLCGMPSADAKRAFIVQRLSSLRLAPAAGEDGSVFLELKRRTGADGLSLMVFASFGHEVEFKAESFSHLDTRTASGAGLGASLCTASLLSLAEGFAAGRLKFARTVVLCFADFEGASRTAASTFKKGGLPGTEKLCAALGLRAFSLGQASIPSKGHFRGELRFASEKGASPDTVPEATANLVLDCIGKKIESKIDENKIEGNGSGEAILQVTRIEAGRGGGIVEVKAESAEKIQLEAASQALREKAALYSSDKLQVSFAVSSSVPPSDPHLADGLLAAIRKAMKEQKIQEDTSEKAGGASFFSSAGIPSLTLALVSGSRTASIDTVEIASVEKGRLFLERCIELVCAEAK